jgi:thioredoxin reductase
VHNYLTRDGMPPADLLAAGRREAERYGSLIISGEAATARRRDDGFEVITAGAEVVLARRLLVSTGLADELPGVPGVRELWGSHVVHCPYCHGWEIAGQATGVLGSGPMAVHQALLFRQWTSDLVLFVHTAPPPTPEETGQLTARGIRVVTGLVDRLDTAGGRLAGVRMHDGRVIARTVLVVAPRMVARSHVLSSLGLRPVPHPLGTAVGELIEPDPNGRTAVPGVWVAGNVTDIQAQVITAAAQGLAAAAAINADLIAEETRRAVEHARAHDAAGA